MSSYIFLLYTKVCSPLINCLLPTVFLSSCSDDDGLYEIECLLATFVSPAVFFSRCAIVDGLLEIECLLVIFLFPSYFFLVSFTIKPVGAHSFNELISSSFSLSCVVNNTVLLEVESSGELDLVLLFNTGADLVKEPTSTSALDDSISDSIEISFS